MAVKVKVKMTGKDAREAADRAKVHEAFHEVMHDTPKIVRRTQAKLGEKRAHKQEVAIALSKARRAGANIPDASGANYVSRNELHDVGADKPRRRVVDRPERAEGSGTGRGNLGTTSNLSTERGLATGSSETKIAPEVISQGRQVGAIDQQNRSDGPDLSSLRPVRRELNPVELCRVNNNAVRDARTNLGRGKAGYPVIEEENQVHRTR